MALFGRGRKIGDLYIETHLDGSSIPADARKIANEAGFTSEKDFEDFGQRAGQRARKGFRKGSSGIEDDFQHLFSTIRGLYDRGERFDAFIPNENFFRRRARRAGQVTREGFFDALFSGGGAGGGGGGFLNLLTGPTGAFFNVSGKSPLAVILIPILGAVIALITAAVYWVQALVSLLYLIPSLLLAIGLQGLTLFLIFNDLSQVVAAVFAAKNAKELEDALKGVNSELGKFAKELLPWRDFFRKLSSIAQTNFFGGIAGSLTNVLHAVEGPLTGFVDRVSKAMARVATFISTAFADPKFAAAIDAIGDSVSKWLVGGTNGGFGYAVQQLINGLNDFAVAIKPFLDWFGDKVINGFIAWLGEKLTMLSQDPEFFKWLEDAKEVMSDGVDLLGQLWTLLTTIIDAFSKADKDLKERNGESFLEYLTTSIGLLVSFFESEAGQYAMSGFIRLLEAMFSIAVALVIIFGVLLNVTDAIYLTFDFLLALAGQFFDAMVGIWEGLKKSVTQAFDLSNVATAVSLTLDRIKAVFTNARDVLINTILPGIKNNILNFFGDSFDWLRGAGTRLIKGLAQGIKEGIDYVRNAMNEVGNVIKSRLPNSPSAEAGPLAGFGDTFYSGKTIVQHLAEGILAGGPSVTNAMNTVANQIQLSPGAVQVNYYGDTPPSRRQAQSMGATVGQRLLDQLTTVRTAARTM